ncbi:pyrroline-5-carboxylate reductase [Psychrosphaera aquimarina]|uniref:Pyrroline-5-carboxylate reductase n=1 Tax=Psychrosphaera aquimarina TaxID=2044854 RepID=A0ABU3R527_9GAMM|nr:pyrroline-5-carboxylate reductase [Psychrosphaera aquimarina]MDU0114753.1 pyrroline-5-carboxylate reductase [Psychrosphaera aquimarina]
MTNNKQLTYAFIGAGNMSGAILGGMVNSGINPDNIIATNRTVEKQQALNHKFGIKTDLDNKSAISQADVIILGVKPQMMLAMLADLVQQGIDFSQKLIITVAAGLTVNRYTDIIGNVRIIRCMPNTPSLVGLGVSGLFCGTDESSFSADVIQQDKEVTSTMFDAVGKTVWLEQESQIDDIAAVSGSGPAYFFLFMQHMADKAVQLGFDQDTANTIVLQTALGSAEMAAQSPDSFEQLRVNVTSPGGSTAEAIRTFNENNLDDIVASALDAAVSRAKEMSKL